MLLIFALFSVLGVNAQVTTNASSGLAATYPSLSAAITALNAATISAPVTITLTEFNPQTAPAGGYSITATGTATNTITINGGSNTITAPAQTAGNLNDAIFKIIGGDYITIQGFTMQERSFTPVAADTAAGTNTMTEWGVALLYATATNGARNNTIQNNTISLNRIYQNTFGIYSNSTHTASSVTTSASATGLNGGNSGLKIYGNAINNVNIGIVVVGPTAAADANQGIDIGGSSLTTGNTLTNFGTIGTFSSYANVSGTVNGILVRNSYGFNISYNSITSSLGGITAGTLNGIQVPASSAAPTTTFTNTISNNTLALTTGASAAINGISYPSGSASATSTLNVNNNNFTAATSTVTSSGAIILISIASTNQFTTINSNTFTNISSNTTGSFTFISQSFTAPATGTKSVNNNSIVTAFAKTGAGGTVTFVTDNGSTVAGAISNCQNNNFSNVTLTGATAITGISYTDGGTAATRTVTGNILNNWTTGAATINAMNFTYWNGVSSLSNNTITNITGQGAITGITIGSAVSTATSIAIANNTINNLSSTGTGGAVTGLSCSNASTTINIYSNAINTLSTTAASAVTGISIGGGTTTNVYLNKIYNLLGTNSGSTVNGILISAGLNINTYNNIIGDLRATAASGTDVIRGISITSTTALSTQKVYNNTLYMNGSSTGVNFGSTGIYHAYSSVATSAALDMRNNIIVNASTAAGTGKSVAFRRSAATDLLNYATTSNNNLFFGTSGIFTDGTNTDLGITAFQTRVGSRETASKSQNPAFVSTIGADATFLHFADGAVNLAGGNGQVIAGYTTDFDGNTRDASTPDMGAHEWNNGVIIAPTITGYSTTYSPFAPFYLCSNGGSVVTITGTSLDVVTSVLFNGSAGVTLPGTITAQSATSLTVTAPADVVDGIIRVSNPAGSGDSVATFTTALPPTIGVSSAATICSGTSTSLVATGANTYTWTPSLGLNGTTLDTVIATPTTSTTYTVTGITTAGCKATNTVSVTVNPTPSAITIAKNPTLVCLGGVSTLTATGGLVGGLTSAILGAGSATSSSAGGTMFSGAWGGHKSQYIIRASELTALGIVAGNPISSVAFEATSAFNGYEGFALNVGQTTANVAAIPMITTGLTQVYTGTGTNGAYATTVGVNTLNFSTPLIWDGTSNIVLSFCWAKNPTATSTTGTTVKVDTAAFVCTSSGQKDSTLASSFCPLSTSTDFGTSTTSSTRPMFTFGYNTSIQTTLAWTPTTDLYSNVGATTAYAGENIATVYTKSLTPQTYTVTATLGACSSTANVTVTPTALPTIAATGTTNCGTAGSAITATGGVSYVWSPALGLNGTSGASVIASPAATTTYTVTGTDANGCVNTTTALVTVNNPVTIAAAGQPANAVVLVGEATSFTVTATGTGLTYQWQINDSTGWMDIAGATAATYSLSTTTLAQNNYQFRCVVSGTAPCTPVTSNAANLGVGTVSIVSQPAAQTICSNNTATFSVVAGGDILSYQWQYSTNGTVWTDLLSADATTASITLSGLTAANSLAQYHCVLNAGQITSNPALLTVSDAIVIGTQPTSQSVCSTATSVTFTAAATGTGLAYQWQMSTNGASWTNVSGATATTYTIANPTIALNGNQYKVIVTGVSPCSTVTSDVATLTVTGVTVSASAAAICIGAPITLSAVYTGTPGTTTSTWACATTGSGATTAVSGDTATVTPTAAGTYVYTFTTNGSCSFAPTVSVTVNPLPIITAVTATPASICSGATVNLAATSISNGPTTTATYAAPPAVTYPTSDEDFASIVIKQGTTTILSNTSANNSLVGTLGTATGTAGSYSDFTSFGAFALTAANAYTFTVSSSTSLTAYGNALAIYIDYNRNGVFTDAGEQVYTSAATTSGAHSENGSFTVPANVSAGYTRMRVISNEGLITSPTQAAYYGEYEEYTINLLGNVSASYAWSWNSTPAVTTALGSTTITNTSGAAVTQAFTATATIAATGCTNAATTTAVTINTTIPAPTATNSVQCGSQTPTCSVTGTGTSGNTFKWYTVALNGTALSGQTASTLVSYPVAATTTFYVAEASADGLCESPRTAVTVTASTPYPFTLSATATTNCSGSASLTPVTIATNGGYSSYSWTNAATVTGNATTGWMFSPTATTTYTVTATDGLCSATANVVVTPTALPNVTISASAAAVCVGTPTTLTALSIGFGPTTSATYTAPPAVTSATADEDFAGIVIKQGTSTILSNTSANNSLVGTIGTATGTAGSYSDFTSFGPYALTAGQAYTFTATSSTSGTAYGNALAIYIDYNRNGVFTDAGEQVYTSAATTLGAHSENGSFTVPAGVSAGYTRMRVISNEGLISSPTQAVYYGEYEEYKINLLGNAPSTFACTWNDPAATTGNTLTVSPATTTPYTVYAYNGVTGCTGSATSTVTVYPFPLAPTATNASQCGTRVPTIAVADANGYTLPTIKWYADATTTTALQSGTSTTYTASVSATTTFYVSVVSPGGCESPRTEVTTTVIAPAVLTVSPAVTVCTGGSTTLTASGAVSYVWTPALGLNGTTGASVIATPGATTTYSVTGVDSNVCTTAAATVTVTVAAYPSALSITQGATSVCTNAVMSLTANGGTIGGAGLATIGAGTATTLSYNYPTAFANYWYQNWQQYLFTAAELNAAGITTAGSISSLQFNISALQDTSAPITDYNVKIGSTSSAALTAFSTNGLTNVYGPAAVTPAVGLNTITFSTPYVWDGVSNIVVDIRQSEAYGNGNATTYYTTTTNNSVLYAYSSSNNAGFWTSAPTPTTSTTRPNITFGYSTVNPTAVTWSPTTDLYTNAAATTAYSGANTSVVYTKPTTEIVYTATAANGACTTTATTTVSPIALPVFTVSSDVTICSGTSTTLEALGSGYTYVWSPALGLNGTTSASVIATPNVTTTYTVEATDLVTGCKATRLVTVTVINSGAILSIGTTTTQTVVASQSTTFTVATASGATYTYQWQLNNGSGWVNLSNAGNYAGVTTATLAVNNIEATFDGYQYQCLVTGAAPCTTLTPVVAVLNISNTGFASQPLDVTMCNSGATTFSIATSGDEPFSIQWQMSTDNGLNYADIANGLNANGLTFAGTDQLTLNVSGVTLANNGVKFTCIVNSYITSNSGTLTVKAPVVITTQPTDQAVCIGGGIATFTAVATGDELSYQWQYSTNGTTWSNYTGTDATTASISIVNPPISAEGTQYHVIVSGNAVCSNVTSANATLHINNPTITAAPNAVSVIRGTTAIFTVTASAATSYQWQSSATMNGTYADVVDATPIGNSYLGNTTASLSVTTSGATVLGAGNYYRCIANNNGCTVTSTGALLTVTDYCASNATTDADEDISNVTIGSLNNSSSCGDVAPGSGSVPFRYSNYTNGNGAPQPADLIRTAVVPFSLSQTSCGGSYNNKFAIFIDWNQNGDFTDAGENVFQQATAAVGNNTQTGTITIPASAALGITRMRVINIETTGAITACATYSWGETEDYLVNVMPTPSCDGTPVAGIASVASTSMCYGNGTNVVLNGSSTGVTGIAYQWYYSANGTSFAPIAGATTTTLATGNLTADAYYYCTVTCTNSTLSANSNTIAITVANPLVTGTTPGGRCATGTVVLGAAGNAGATINWYSALNGGSPIGTGTSFTTPSISATTTYYAQASAGGTTQVSSNGTASFTTTTINTGLVLDITTASVLTSLDVYSTNAGTVTMQLVNSAGTVVAGPTSGAVIAGTIATPQTINLGWSLPVGTGYKILVTSQTGALGYSSGSFPSPLGNGVGTIVNGATSTGTTTLNYFLYNLRTTSACQSARTAVIATVDPTPTATISYAGAPFCNNAAVGSVTLNGTNAYTGGTYTSTSGLSLNGTSGDINPATSTPGTYVVTYTTNPTMYCTPQTATTTVVINESVLYSGFTYAAATYCNNSGIVTPTITGTPGAFTVSPATGLTVNATTGAIDFATAAPGTYTVTNTVTACNNNSVTNATITVYSTVVVTTQPTSATVCAGANSSMNVAATGTNVVYQWQMSSNGTTWSNVTNGGAYSGATTATLALTGVTNSMTGTQFRALVSDANPCVGVTSSVATLTVSQPAAPVFTPAAPSVCIGSVNALSVSSASFAQNGVIGTGTVANTTSTPFKGYWGGSKAQYIYTAAELSALGYVNGTIITSVGFDIAAYLSPYTFNGFNIAMKNSTATVSAAAFETGMTTVKAPTNYVLTGAAPFTATLPLDTNFTWDGTSNLVVQFCFNNVNGGGSSTNSAGVKSTTNATALTTYYTADNNASVCSTATGTTSTTRPNMRFGVISGSLTWSPTTELYTNAAATTAYTGGMATTVYTKPTANRTYTVTATNLLGCSNTASVNVTILAPSTLGSIVQPAVTCSGFPTTFNLTGLVANSTSTLSYTINGVAQTAITGVVADASGNAMFTVSLPAINNGKTLAVTTITRTDLTPNCPTAITANNTLVIAVNPLVTYYADADGDGFGNNALTQVGCGVAPAGFVLNNADCDDTNPAIHAMVPYYVDADGDGFGSVITTSFCTATTPVGYAVNNLDCNDTVYSTTNICPSVVNLKFNIEGYYSAATQSMVPAKFNQSVVGATNTDVDDVTVELRTVANGTLVDTAIAALKTNGTAVATFATGAAGSFYLVVKYKNAVETWSALPQTVGLTPLTYNFTNAANKAFGSNMVQVTPGVFAIYSGDINQDTNIDNLDYSVWEEDVNNFMSGYYPTDLNGDGNVDNLDYSIWETNSNNFIYSINPFN